MRSNNKYCRYNPCANENCTFRHPTTFQEEIEADEQKQMGRGGGGRSIGGGKGVWGRTDNRGRGGRREDS